MGLANNKSCGPDGIPNEFCKLNWDLVKNDISQIFTSLYNDTLELSDSNLAHIVLIPKEDNALKPTDFRPISILNYIPKLIAKVLANRLTHLLPSLIADSQTGFIKGRLISENFNVARELVTHVSKCKEQTVLLKIDFHKAFDSVAWSFLFSLLNQRGFPTKFISWIKLLLSTATSSITVNGMIGTAFLHKRGLRQGDPLSPGLFTLAVDALAKMVQAVSLAVPHVISNRIAVPFYLLQYADDTLIFATAKGNSLSALQFVLNAFSSVSGIRINPAKTSLVPFNLSPQQIERIQHMFTCKLADLPLKYLGLPLTFKRPDRATLQTLIDKIYNKLSGWKSRLLSRAGRIVLASSVLSTIPIFFMSVFKLPPWVIKAIDKIRRNFIWRGNNLDKPGVHLIAWDNVCLPKEYGGLGLLNLRLHNISLLLRWIWRLYSQQNSQWTAISRALYSKPDPSVPPMAWNQSGSFFWKDIMALRFFFQISTRTEVRSGNNSLFWYDNWNGSVLSYFGKVHQAPPMRFISLQHAVLRWNDLFQFPMNQTNSELFHTAHSLHLTTGKDSVIWKWTENGHYSCASIYRMLVTAGKVKFQFHKIWNLRLPLTIKLFLLLLCHNRILTQDQLLKRKINFQQGCSLCGQPVLECPTHLFTQCNFATQLWSSLPLTITPTGGLQALFKILTSITTSASTKTAIATTLWAIWLERNARVFRNDRRTVQAIQDWIVAESTLFMNFC